MWKFISKHLLSHLFNVLTALQQWPELCAHPWNVSCWGTNQTAFSSAMPWLCWQSQHCWGAVLKVSPHSTSWKTRIPVWASCVCCLTACLQLAACCKRTYITCGICGCSWGVYRSCILCCCWALWDGGRGGQDCYSSARSSRFFPPPSPNWLKQPNMHSFLGNQEVIWGKNSICSGACRPKKWNG